jgi:hypothetical protein
MRVVFKFSLEQSLCVSRGDPSALLRDANRHDFIFIFVDGVENGCSGEQRDFMLSAAAAKENADSNFFHDLSVWTRDARGVNCGLDSLLLVVDA